MGLCNYSRRQFLAGSGALITWAYQTRIAASSPGRDPRLLVINLRGGLDGVGAVAPVGDPAYHALREEAVLSGSDPSLGIPLDGMFVLHPALKTLGELYRQGQVLIAHAISTPYRNRSHFDAQDVLESGLAGPGTASSGWLNRALSGLAAGEALAPAKGLAIGAQVPLILRGDASVMSWMPPGYAPAGDDIRSRLHGLYQHTDAELFQAFQGAMELEEITGGEAAMRSSASKTGQGKQGADKKAQMSATAVGKLLSDPEGPRIGAMDLNGWDTHINGEPFDPRFISQLKRLDAVISSLQATLQPVWDQTTICVITEFGRTVRINGSSGTDHGVATAAFLIGGGINGGKMLTDWPGLGERDLYEGRDLRPTADIRGLFKGVLREGFDMTDRQLDEAVFPDSEMISPAEGIMRS